LDVAMQIKPDDAGIRYQYGYALGSLHKLQEAEVQLKKAIELDPDFAAPHFALGEVYEASKRYPEALKEVQTFLALSAMNDRRREVAAEMVASLAGAK
jgi:tetratricopeptide (TPR) repeat protein